MPESIPAGKAKMGSVERLPRDHTCRQEWWDDVEWSFDREGRQYVSAGDPWIIRQILSLDREWAGRLAYDAFSHRTLLVGETAPWDDLMGTVTRPGPWLDVHTSAACAWLAAPPYRCRTNPSALRPLIDMVSRENEIHVVRDWLDSLPPWDGVDRILGQPIDGLGSMFETYLGAGRDLLQTDAYLALVAKIFMVSAVARVSKPRAPGEGGPGCKVDVSMILESKQGKGKQRFGREGLVPRMEWYMDSPIDMGSLSGALITRHAWIVNLDECDFMDRRGLAAIKAYMTRPEETVVMKFQNDPTTFPRQFVCYATINPPPDGKYLVDSENRRWAPVVLGSRQIDVAALIRDREQLWAEALYLYRTGVNWWPSEEEQESIMGPVQESGLVDSVAESLIAEWLIGREGEVVTIAQLLAGALHIEAKDLDKHKKTAMDALRACGWVPEGPKRAHGGRARIWRKKGD